MARTSNPSFLNGVPEMLVLSVLSDRPMHGYELVQTIHQRSKEALDFGEGCIYPVLHRLEADGLLHGRREAVAGRSRVVYQVTARGRKHLAETTSGWQRIVAAVNTALQGGDCVEPGLA